MHIPGSQCNSLLGQTHLSESYTLGLALLTASYGVLSLLSVIEIDLNGFMHLACKFAD